MSTKVMESGIGCQKSESPAKMVIMALQHLVAMFGATVLVPMLTGFNPAVALVAAGCGTLLFHLCTKGKVPVFLGSSFAFITPIIVVRDMQGLQYAQGGIMVAGLIYVILSFLIKSIGVERINKYLPPQVIGPMIMVIGLNLIPTAWASASGNLEISKLTFEVVINSINLQIAGLTLAVALGITFFAKGFIKQLSILIAVLVGYAAASVAGIVDTQAITQASWFAIPAFTAPKFSMTAILTIAPVVIAVFMEHIGDVKTNGTVVGKDFVKDPGLNRTLLGDGLATMFAGFVGGPANTTYGENTGVLAITKNYNPQILRIAAVFAICLGLLGKMVATLGTIPQPVMGGISLMLFSMIALVGVRTIRDNDVNFNVKNIIVIAAILILGFGASYIEALTGVPMAITITENVQFSGLSLAAVVGVLLNAILNR